MRTTAAIARGVLIAFALAGLATGAVSAEKKKDGAAKKAEAGASCKAPAIATCAACSITCRPGETAACTPGVAVNGTCHTQPFCRCTK